MRMPVPREHGTWAMLYAPIICAAVSAWIIDARLILFLISTTAAFFLREPLETWIRFQMRGAGDPKRLLQLRNWSIVFLSVSLVASGILIVVWKLWFLPFFASIFGAMLGLHLFWIYRKSDRRFHAEIAGVIALTSSAPACRYVMIGRIDRISLVLWLLNALFFVSSVFYVKKRVSIVSRRHNTQHASAWCDVYHALLTIVLIFLSWKGLISWTIIFAFLPVILRSFLGVLFAEKLSLTRLGISEVAFTLVFVTLMVISF